MNSMPTDLFDNVLTVDFKKRPEGEESRMFTVKEFRPISECQHKAVMVDETLAEVTCKDCGEKLNPVWVLINMAKAESRWERNRERYRQAKEEIDKRSRTKCQHCGKMTLILK